MNFRPLKNTLRLLLLSSVLLSASSLAKPPNIVLILTDDLGINDLGCYGNDFYESPHIDRLSQEGMRFDQHYSAGSVCSPTRTALVTGKFPARTHSTEVYPWGLNNQYFAEPLWCEPDQLLSPDSSFLPRVLRGAGYRTAMFGKWHIDGVSPEEAGYDETLVNHCETTKGEDANQDEFYLGEITRRSNAFMKAAVESDVPFFVTVSHHSVHVPQAATTESREYFERKGALPEWADRPPLQTPVYAGMIKDLDNSVGDLLAEIDRLEIADNTLVIFTSDNGGLGDLNFPYRGGKGSWYEGGIRVPFIAKWPERIPAGSINDDVVVTTDYFRTLVNLAGGTMPRGAAPDSVDFSGALMGQSMDARSPIIFHFPHYRGKDGNAWLRPWSAIRDGDHVFILHWEVQLLKDGGPGRIKSHELYDLSGDPGQDRNLIGTRPDLAARMQAELLSRLESMGAQIPRLMSERSVTPETLGGHDHAAVTPVVQTADYAVEWWMPRHEEILQRIRAEPVDLVFMGDSLTRGWENVGKAIWDEYYQNRNAVNLGFGGDKTQHVLWRIAHGELDGISPKLVVVSIGTNNAWGGDPSKSFDGIEEVCLQILARLPRTEILLLSLFPRADDDERREVNEAVNRRLPQLAKELGIRYMDIVPFFSQSDGKLREGLFRPDRVHITAAGYAIWAEALEPEILRVLNEKF